jgi:Na+-translocating ferredoxin:NAD+ oxidoreductase RnfE subunit
MSGLRRTGRTPSALQLNVRFRFGLYAIFAVLFVTGAVWLIADSWKESADAEFWQTMSAALLMIHGGAAMVTLVVLGALIPVHMRRAWLSRKNRVTGSLMAAANVVLVVTAFGLYYSGSDVLRAWTSDAHIAVGLAFPILLTTHIVIGRRAARSAK